jgi:hypothetical protein
MLPRSLSPPIRLSNPRSLHSPFSLPGPESPVPPIWLLGRRKMMTLLTPTSLFLLVALSNHEHAKRIDAFAPICPSSKIQSPQQRVATSRTRKIHSTFQTTHYTVVC